jgi:nitrogen fixation protein FixH
MRSGEGSTSPSRPSRGSLRWPLIIVALLGGHVALMLTAAAIAVRDRSFAVVPNYYQSALHWDQQQAERRVSAELGWKVQVEPAAQVDPTGGRAVRFVLRDAGNKPIEGATLSLRYYHHAHASDAAEIRLAREEQGVFSTTLPMRYAGFWQFDVTAEARGRTFTTSLTQYVSNESRK